MSGTGFRGFADFASPSFPAASGSTTAAATLAAARAAKRRQQRASSQSEHQHPQEKPSSRQNSNVTNDLKKSRSSLRPSPIYAGSDARLSVLFRKIGQKRDPATKSRALEELVSTVFPPLNDSSPFREKGDDFSRPEKIAALCHLTFLHETKLGYDNNSFVRSGSYKALTASKAHIPKAWAVLFVGETTGQYETPKSEGPEVTGELCTASTSVGMAWGASRSDPAAEVARNASAFVKELTPTGIEKEGNTRIDISGSLSKTIRTAVCQYSKAILSCKRASSLQDVINPVTVSSSHTIDVDIAAGKGRKTKGITSKVNSSSDASVRTASSMSESEREEVEERYERVILSAIAGLGWLFECQPEKNPIETSSEFIYSKMQPFPDSGSIVRLLHNSRGSFRREGYMLVGKICQFARSLIFHQNSTISFVAVNSLPLGSLIPNLISSERDPSNFVPLLEMVLSYLAAFRDGSLKDNTNGPWKEMDAAAFTKSLGKVLRRACCGAPASCWGPALLPIVATLPNSGTSSNLSKDEINGSNKNEKQDCPMPMMLVESLWEGRNSAVGFNDKAAIVSAMTECVSFLILRRVFQPLPASLVKCGIKYGELFLNALSYFLTELPDVEFGSTAAAVRKLGITLALDLQKFDMTSSSNDVQERGFFHVQTWFWGEDGLQSAFCPSKVDHQVIRKLSFLFRNIPSIRVGPQNGGTLSHILPSCRKVFRFVIVDCTGRNNKTCGDDEVNLIFNTIDLVGVDQLFPLTTEDTPNDGSLPTCVERFCVNDLLRWILVHASKSPSIIATDFQILGLCLKSIHSFIRRKQIWETVLRELIKSYCDFTTIAIGLSTVCGQNQDMKGDVLQNENQNLLPCEVLDSFALETSGHVINLYHQSHDLRPLSDNEESTVFRKGDISLFLRTCLGIGDNRVGILVSRPVITHWIQSCCEHRIDNETLEDRLILEDESGSNVLLQTLLLLSISPNTDVVSCDEMVQLVLESWMQGGKIWEDLAISLMDSHLEIGPRVKEKFVSIASSALCNDIHSKPPANQAILELTCQSWSKRASRLLEVSRSSSPIDIGLSASELWTAASLSDERHNSEFLHLCLMYLLHSIDTASSRTKYLFGELSNQLFVQIQTAIAETDRTLLRMVQNLTLRNHELVEILGGADVLTGPFLENSCMEAIEYLSLILKDSHHENINLIRKSVTSFRFLMSVLIPSVRYYQSASDIKNVGDEDVEAVDIREGDLLWYEKDREHPVQVLIVKVHTNDFPNLYFTVKELDSVVERQTIASKLKRQSKTNIASARYLLDGHDLAKREQFGRLIVDIIVKPYTYERSANAHKFIANEVSAECINIITTQCGLVGSGVGSVRYDIFQTVSSMEHLLCEALSTPDSAASEAVPLLRCMALSLGFRSFTAPSYCDAEILNIDTSGSLSKLLDLYDNTKWIEEQKDCPFESLHLSVLMWVTVATRTITDGHTFRRLSSLIHSLSDILLPNSSRDTFINSIYIIKAFSSTQDEYRKHKNNNLAINYDEKNVMVKLTQCFVDLEKNNLQKGSSSVSNESFWLQSFSSLLRHNLRRCPEMILLASRSCVNDLSSCIFSSSKRWCAFQMLQHLAKESSPLQPNANLITLPGIDRHLTKRTETMDEEATDDYEDDVRIAACWLPQNMMNLLDSLETKVISPTNMTEREDHSVGILLSWILCMDILDSAGSVDMRNRSSISSFIQKTNAIGFVMNLALSEADLETRRDDDIFACLKLDSDANFSLQEVSALAIFRTVESLPTLVKTWFNDDCSRFLQSKLSAFVESRVAPESLQRELNRIQEMKSFGEMKVSGSCVSREVTATYQQDECQLSVVIRIPSTFPLRNVEVDCQKTLGIAESRWRRWALQIMLMLNSQDGSVLDALLLWKQNVDKEFDGVEPCPVCYSVLCIKTHAMPNLECKTCKNRFHSSCLYKWFQSSGKSQCVLCQQTWSGTKV